ncbi:MAG: hypothetical protein IJA77_12240 [Clostridia bacterium]|nr:hypothetical protein [Clostridia bacterium]
MKRMREQSMLTTLTSLYGYIYCMMAAQALTGVPIYGGALFMCGQVAAVFGQAFSPRTKRYLPPKLQPWRWVLLVLMLLLSLFLVILYPLTLKSPHMWLMFALVLSMQLRDIVCLRLVRLNITGRLAERRFLVYAGLWHIAAAGTVLAVLLSSLEVFLALSLLGGYILCSLVAYYNLLKQRDRMVSLAAKEDAEAEPVGLTVRKANAYAVFEKLSTLIMAAMEMTLIVMYTYLAATAEQILIRMAMAVLTTLVSGEMAEWLLKWRQEKNKGDHNNLMLVGLAMWLAGLWVFSQRLSQGTPDLTITYVCLALCSVGSALCTACLEGLERTMVAVARFAAGDDVSGYHHMRAAGREIATLLGQMLALAALTALCFLTGGQELPETIADLTAHFKPVMVVPALLVVFLALLFALRYPISGRYSDKILRFLHIRESGGENPALEKQLESVVIQRHTQPWLIRALMALIRPAFRHTLKDADHVVPDESNPIVFLCNHGEVYGPVAGMLFCPVPVRSWSISDMMIDPKEVAEYSYKYTFSQIKWLGPLRWPVARILGYVSVWGMTKLEAVPVYRNKPRELMVTFRKSVEAMQAGDNLLIFPENPDADPDAPGYEDGRPGELFRGFPMLAQVYYNKTGKRCRFLPMLAHKGMRTLSFGTEIVYDPDASPIDERDRIVEEASRQMQALFEREEALFQKKKDK